MNVQYNSNYVWEDMPISPNMDSLWKLPFNRQYEQIR